MATSEFANEMGRRVKQRRVELSMSQEELSQKVGLAGKSSICKIEKGSNTIPANKIPMFADALKTSIAFIVGLEKE